MSGHVKHILVSNTKHLKSNKQDNIPVLPTFTMSKS